MESHLYKDRLFLGNKASSSDRPLPRQGQARRSRTLRRAAPLGTWPGGFPRRSADAHGAWAPAGVVAGRRPAPASLLVRTAPHQPWRAACAPRRTGPEAPPTPRVIGRLGSGTPHLGRSTRRRFGSAGAAAPRETREGRTSTWDLRRHRPARARRLPARPRRRMTRPTRSSSRRRTRPSSTPSRSSRRPSPHWTTSSPRRHCHHRRPPQGAPCRHPPACERRGSRLAGRPPPRPAESRRRADDARAVPAPDGGATLGRSLARLPRSRRQVSRGPPRAA
jgi:hypothetical protein